MSKYFIKFDCTAGSLAIEKAMYHYIREHYDYSLVEEDKIESIAQDLRREIDAFLLLHRQAKPIEVRATKHSFSDTWGIQVGQMYVTLYEVRREI